MSSLGGVGIVSGSSDTSFASVVKNSLPVSTAVVSGPVYCIQASGGYRTEQSFDTIRRLSETIIGRYDVTGAVEVLMDVRLFNEKIGVIKKADNIDLSCATSTYYDDVSNMLITDSISISAQEFIEDISKAGAASSIVSVGLLSSIYSDFANYVATYFGMPNLPSGTNNVNPNEYGFATLFANDPNFNPNAGVFDPDAFYQLLQKSYGSGAIGWQDGSGASVTTLSGTVTISNITSLLRNAVDANPFNNRDSVQGNTASDPFDRSNYGVTDGFFSNDLFFIPNNGFQITLKLKIDDEAFGDPKNNVGSIYMNNKSDTSNISNAYAQNISGVPGTTPGDVSGVIDASFGSGSKVADITKQTIGATSGTNSTFMSMTQVSSTLIQRIVQAPLLIRLKDFF